MSDKINFSDIDFDQSKRYPYLVTSNLKENQLDEAFIEGQEDNDAGVIHMANLLGTNLQEQDDIVMKDINIPIVNDQVNILILKEKMALDTSKRTINKICFSDLLTNIKCLSDRWDGISKIKKLKFRRTSRQESINSNIIK
jgi:hypothetical protein